MTITPSYYNDPEAWSESARRPRRPASEEEADAMEAERDPLAPEPEEEGDL